MIEEDDITIYDSSVGFDAGRQFSLEITDPDVNKLIDIRKEILDNQKIVERLKLQVGKHGGKYGYEYTYHTLHDILHGVSAGELKK